MSPMTAGSPPSGGDALEGATPADTRKSPLWLRPFEAVAALLMLTITVLLLTAVISRYVFGKPLVSSDEVVSICFIWLTMLGAAIAVHRNEHLRLALFVDLMPERVRSFVHAFALMAMAAMLVALIPSAEIGRAHV